MTDEFVDDELERWTGWGIKLLIGISFGIILGIVAYLAGFRLAKKPEDIRWIEQPFTAERNPQGQIVDNIVLGFDNKGYVRWGRAAVPPPQPAPAALTVPQPAPPANPAQNAKPGTEPKRGK